jgi:hypothetical protein
MKAVAAEGTGAETDPMAIPRSPWRTRADVPAVAEDVAAEDVPLVEASLADDG